jgi:hypothetical protein
MSPAAMLDPGGRTHRGRGADADGGLSLISEINFTEGNETEGTENQVLLSSVSREETIPACHPQPLCPLLPPVDQLRDLD